MKVRSIGSFFSPRHSLQAQIGLLFGALTILLTSLLSVAVGQQTKTRIEANTGRTMEQMAHQLTDDLDRGSYDYYLETQDIAQQVASTDSQAALASKRKLLTHAIQLHDDIAWISLVDTDGQVVVSTDMSQERRDVSGEAWYSRGQFAPTTADIQINGFAPNADPSQTIVLYVLIPWLDENQQPLGLVITAVRCTFVDERVTELMETAMFDSLQVIVTQADGTVIASTNGTPFGASWADQSSYQMSLHQASGHHIESLENGDQYVTGYAVMDGFRDFAGLDWRVLVRKDAATAFAPAGELVRSIFWTGLALGVTFAAAGYVLGGRITTPLVKMATAADAIRAGQPLELPVTDGQNEVARLGYSLRALVDQLTHEIDERRTLEAQFRAMFELSLDVILVADGHKGAILQVNPAVQRLLGYEPAALVGKPFLTLFPPERASREEILERLRVYGAVFEEQEFLRQDGSVILMDLTATMMPYQGNNGILITLRDISERHQLMLAQLESDAMRNQLAEQEQALNLKSTIVSVASHDLRNPLATILLSTDIIRRYGDRIPEEKRVGHFLRIETSIKYMQKLLDDLNLMEKMERGLVQPTPDFIDMHEFCHTLMDEALATTEIVREFHFTLDPACARVVQDPRLLRQAISNLLTNALKYSREGHPIEFAVHLASHDRLRISVRDYGIGIPEKDQKDLFTTFHRAKNASAIPGTGLGLAITRRAVDSMQGTLEFISIENEGTTFIIEIPLIMESSPSGL